MAVGSGTPYNIHTGTGAVTVFAYGFTLLDAGDLVVTLDGVETSAYTVQDAGEPDGGTVTFNTAPASGVEIILRRVIALVRTTDYQNNGDLRASVVNNDHDREWMAIQQLADAETRSVRAPFPETIPALPSAAARAGRLLSFDDDGNPAATAPTEGTATALAADLASTASATKGAGMSGFDGALNYASHTIGWGLRAVGGGLNALRYVPPAEWPAILDGTSTYVATADIQAALDAYDDVYLPIGRWNIDASLTLNRGQTLRGASRSDCSLVMSDAASPAIIAMNPQPSNAQMDARLADMIVVGGSEGLKIGANGAATPGVAMTCERVWFYNNAVNLRIANGWSLSFNDCRFLSPTGAACVIGEFPTGGAFLNTTKFTQCEFQPVAAQYGVLLPAGNANGWVFDTCIFENSTHGSGIGVALPTTADACQGVTIRDCYFERFPGGCIRLSDNAANGNITISGNRFYAPSTASYEVIATIRGASILGNLFSMPGSTPVPIAEMTDCDVAGNMRMDGSGVIVGALVPDVTRIKSAAGRHNAGLMLPVDVAQGNSLRTTAIWQTYQPPALFAISSGTSGDFKHIATARPYGVDGSNIQHFVVQALPLILRVSTNDNGASYFLNAAPYGSAVTKVATGVVNISVPAGIIDNYAEVQRHFKTAFSPGAAAGANLKHVVAIQSAPDATNEIQLRFYNAAGAAADLATSENALVEVVLMASD